MWWDGTWKNYSDNLCTSFYVSIRKNKKLSQIDLAMRINGDDNKIGRIERGEYNFKVASLLVIAQALDVEVTELFEIKEINFLKNNILEYIDNVKLTKIK